MSILSTDKIENRSFSRQGVVWADQSLQWSRDQKHSSGVEGVILQYVTPPQTIDHDWSTLKNFEIRAAG